MRFSPIILNVALTSACIALNFLTTLFLIIFLNRIFILKGSRGLGGDVMAIAYLAMFVAVGLSIYVGWKVFSISFWGYSIVLLAIFNLTLLFYMHSSGYIVTQKKPSENSQNPVLHFFYKEIMEE